MAYIAKRIAKHRQDIDSAERRAEQLLAEDSQHDPYSAILDATTITTQQVLALVDYQHTDAMPECFGESGPNAWTPTDIQMLADKTVAFAKATEEMRELVGIFGKKDATYERFLPPTLRDLLRTNLAYVGSVTPRVGLAEMDKRTKVFKFHASYVATASQRQARALVTKQEMHTRLSLLRQSVRSIVACMEIGGDGDKEAATISATLESALHAFATEGYKDFKSYYTVDHNTGLLTTALLERKLTAEKIAKCFELVHAIGTNTRNILIRDYDFNTEDGPDLARAREITSEWDGEGRVALILALLKAMGEHDPIPPPLAG
jgi:hypothetical protein